MNGFDYRGVYNDTGFMLFPFVYVDFEQREISLGWLAWALILDFDPNGEKEGG